MIFHIITRAIDTVRHSGLDTGQTSGKAKLYETPEYILVPGHLISGLWTSKISVVGAGRSCGAFIEGGEKERGEKTGEEQDREMRKGDASKKNPPNVPAETHAPVKDVKNP